MKQERPKEIEGIILAYLGRVGSDTTANIGSEWFASNGQASNPGTLAAASVLRSLERRGIVTGHKEIGKGYMRTIWTLKEKTK